MLNRSAAETFLCDLCCQKFQFRKDTSQTPCMPALSLARKPKPNEPSCGEAATRYNYVFAGRKSEVVCHEPFAHQSEGSQIGW